MIEEAVDRRQETVEMRRVYLIAASAGIVLFFAFLVLVYAYVFYGKQWVDGLDDSIGEIVARRAKGHLRAGQTEEAIRTYFQAAELSFDDPRQRDYVLRGLGELLLEKDRPEEAIPVLQECVALFPDDMLARTALANAFRKTEDWAGLIEMTTAWAASAVELGKLQSASSAKYRQGQAYEALDRHDDAVKAYLEGDALDPDSVNAFHAGALLLKRGMREEALPLLRRYVEGHDDWRARRAAQMTEGQ
jgi:tetratricopeptide (TPR) repeat protein